MKMTVKQYAEKIGSPKITILKKIDRKEKLKGVSRITKSIGSYNPTYVLHVNETELAGV